jgi:hypothetical protein
MAEELAVTSGTTQRFRSKSAISLAIARSA